MKLREKARGWALYNTIPDKTAGAADETYQMLVSVQTAAYLAGYREALKDAASCAQNKSHLAGVSDATLVACRSIAHDIAALGKEEG